MTDEINEAKAKKAAHRNSLAKALRAKIFQHKVVPSGKKYNRQKEKAVNESKDGSDKPNS